MRHASTNYVKFGPREMIVSFATDRGQLKTTDGEGFYRQFSDGQRFCFANPDLERRLLDMNYRAGEQVGITRATQNRIVVWKVRRLEPMKSESAANGAEERFSIRAHRTPIPESKYADPPAPQWDDLEHDLRASLALVKDPPRKTAAEPALITPPAVVVPPSPILSPRESIKAGIRQALFDAIDVARDSQKYAAEHGLNFTFGAPEIQDLASTIYIQEGKQANINLMNRNNSLRAQRDGDAWRH